MKIEGLSFGALQVTDRGRSTSIDITGVSGDDLVACMDEELLIKTVEAIGADKVVEILGLELAE